MAPERATELDVNAVRARARGAYERGRAREAIVAASFAVPFAVVVGLVEHHLVACLVVGAALGVTVAFLHFRGRDLARGIVPGIVAGVAPLAFANLSMKLHLCIGDSCTSACIVACAAGGLAAGLFSAWFARRSTFPRAAWVSAVSVALLVGALGCVCVGVFGVLGLVGGLLVGSAPLVLRPALTR
jgi:hypothetical protein